MGFEMKFRTANDAFFRDGTREVAFLLEKVRDAVILGHEHGTLFDLNGGHVGEWSLEWDYSIPEPDEDDDTLNMYEHELDGWDDDGNEIRVRVHYRWSEPYQEWYEADHVQWDDKRGVYVPKDE